MPPPRQRETAGIDDQKFAVRLQERHMCVSEQYRAAAIFTRSMDQLIEIIKPVPMHQHDPRVFDEFDPSFRISAAHIVISFDGEERHAAQRLRNAFRVDCVIAKVEEHVDLAKFLRGERQTRKQIMRIRNDSDPFHARSHRRISCSASNARFL